MKIRKIINGWLPYLLVGFFVLIADDCLAAAQLPTAPANRPAVAYLQILASVGPLEYLSKGNVTLRDALGHMIAKRKTNIRGSTIFSLSKAKLSSARMPLKITTSGGRIIGLKGDKFPGLPFKGHLRAQIDKVPLEQHSIVYLDLLSTSASVMQSRTESYASSTKAVRDALSIGKGFPVNGIRFRNNHVGWTQLEAAILENRGYDRYVRNMVYRIKQGEKITELTPPLRPLSSQPSPSRVDDIITNALSGSHQYVLSTDQADTASTQSTYPVCNVPFPNGSTNNASTEVIEDYGVIAMEGLLQYAGIPSSSVTGVAGMLLTGGADGAPTASQLDAVEEQLSCISAELGYLSEQVAELTLLTDVDQNAQCGNAVVNQYYTYQGLVEDAQDCTGSSCQLNSNNPSLMADLPTWSPSSTMVSATCGGPLGTNNMLFGSAGGQGAAWQQLNQNYQSTNGGYAWYTAAQVQQLQQFLAYWATVEYDLFLLTNEYDNYYQLFENATLAAGNVPGSATVCTSGSTNATPTYCVAQSNIANAYPPDLYSDEIGIWNTVNGGGGLAINAYPAGLAMGLGQVGLNPYYLGQVTPDPGSWSASNATNPSYNQFNSQGINPSGQPSAIEQFSNPQALRTLQPTKAQVSSILNPQTPGGVQAWNFFVDELQQGWDWTPAPPVYPEWYTKNLTPSNTNQPPTGTGFFTADNVGEFSHVAQGGPETCNDGTEAATVTTYDFNTTIGSYYWQYTSCGGGATPNNSVNLAPVFGVLLGRTWWSAYASNNPPTSYVPPNPPTQ